MKSFFRKLSRAIGKAHRRVLRIMGVRDVRHQNKVFKAANIDIDDIRKKARAAEKAKRERINEILALLPELDRLEADAELLGDLGDYL